MMHFVCLNGMITAVSLTISPTLFLSVSLAGIQSTAGSRAVPLGPTPKVRRDLKGQAPTSLHDDDGDDDDDDDNDDATAAAVDNNTNNAYRLIDDTISSTLFVTYVLQVTSEKCMLCIGEV